MKDDNLYHLCNSKCTTCKTNETNCLQCSKQFTFNDIKDDNCCDNYYYIDQNKVYNCLGKTEECYDNYPVRIINTRECLEKCPSEYPNLIKKTKECVFSCPNKYPLYTKELHLCDNQYNKDYPFLYKQTNNCLSECPNQLKSNKHYICSLDIENASEPLFESNNVQYNTTMNTETFQNSINKTIGLIMNQLSPNEKNTIIKSELFTFILSPSNINENTSALIKEKINLGECENILRKAYNIPENEDLFIGQFKYQSTISLSTKKEYSVYDIKGNKLDINLCKDTPIIMSASITSIVQDDIFQEIQQLYNQYEINVLNTSEVIFNDKCTSFSINDRDMTVSDRRKRIMQNTYLCEDECQLTNVNYNSNFFDCECFIRDIGLNSSINKKKISIKQDNYDNSNNFYLFLCYNIIIKFKVKLTNYVIWLMIVCIIN